MKYYPEITIKYKEPMYVVCGKRKWWFFTWWEELADGCYSLDEAEDICRSAREWNGIGK